jgi:hypothetical protein
LSPLRELDDRDVREWLLKLPNKPDEDDFLQRLAELRALHPNKQVRLRKFSQMVRKVLAY